MRRVFGRALRALAAAPLNRPLILDAGGLGPLLGALCDSSCPEAAHQAVAVLALLSKVWVL